MRPDRILARPHREDGPGPDTDAARQHGRDVWADNLKVALVTGVILAHAIIAWTGIGNWVLTAPPVREPLLSVLMLLSLVGVMFGMALFFMLAGTYTPRSLARKGLRRFLVDRTVRLGIPLLVFVVLLAPVVEYVDDSNAGWDEGFWSLTVTVVWWPPLRGLALPPAWGPTWFLAVLLLFSAVYAVARWVVPARPTRTTLRGRHLVTVAALVALGSYLVRLRLPLGEEWFRLALGQAPAWIAGFGLGVAAGERGWFAPVDPVIARRARRTAWGAMTGVVLTMALAMTAGSPIELFAGGATWQSALTCAFEGILVATVPVWLIDIFRRRLDRRGRIGREVGRAAFAAFLVHQLVLALLVVAARSVPWPPEVAFTVVSLLAVLLSFALGAALVRLPHVSRVL